MDPTRRSITSFVLSAAAALALSAPGDVLAQTGTVTGTVVDAASGRPLVQAQVSIEGTRQGGLTNDAGRFLILGVPAGPQVVRVDNIGYTSATREVSVTAGGTATADFRLESTAISLNEIVVTGVGQATERKRLGTTVDVIDSRDIEAAPVTTVGELLQGRVSGANVSAVSSQPGTGSLINFRGVSSVFASQTPVIYVDGVRVDNDQSTAAGTGGEQSSALADLLTSDIERIEVTRGGAASTLYGSDAATGVIQIFTKKGRPGAPRITARVEQGIHTPDESFMLDAENIFPDQVADGANPNFLSDEFFRNGHVQNYYLGISGGTAETTYNVSGRFDNQEGIQPKNDNTIFNLRGALEANPNDALRLRFSGSFTRSDFGRLFNGTAIADPLTALEVGDALAISGTTNLDDALRIFILPDIDEEVNRWIFSTGADYVFTDAWTARATIGLDQRSSHQRVFEPIGFTPGEETGELNARHRNFNSVSLDVATSYAWPQDGTVTSSFTVGAQGFREDEEIINGSGTGFALPGAEDFDNAATVDAFEANSEIFNGGIYLDEQVGLWDRLFLGLGVRFDAGSVFGDEIDLETYPKATLAYVVSEEDFFSGSLGGFVDEFRIRGAYGSTGKFPPPFAKDLTFSAASFRGESAPRFANPGNEDLQPEITTTFEAGFDLALLSNRVGLNFTWFDATTEEALFDVPEQPVTGQGVQLRNVGELSNKGIETSLNVTVLNRADVAWSVGGTYNTVDNEVTSLGGFAPFFVPGTDQYVYLGAPVGAWYVTTPFDSNGDGLNDDSRQQFIQTGGTCSEAELTGSVDAVTGTITPLSDGCEVASPTPTTFGSFNTTLTLFNSLNISAMADWARGHHVMDWGSVWATFNGIQRREIVTGCEENSADCVRFPVQHDEAGDEIGTYFAFDAISAFIYDGDWFKLREIALRYSLPESIASRLGATRGTISGSARNLWIWTDNKMVDSELSGLNGGGLVLGSETSITMSPPRAFRLGVELVF